MTYRCSRALNVLMRSSRQGWLVVAGVTGILPLALSLMLWATDRWGPWANSDGLMYLVMARWLYRLRGPGYPTPAGFRIVTHFPPGYPALIALFMLFTRGDEARAALYLHLVAVTLLLYLAAWEVYRRTRHGIPAWVLALWLAVAAPMQRFYTGVFSEIPFLVLVLLVGHLGEKAKVRPRLYPWLGLLVAGSVYVRWIGLALVPWMALEIVLTAPTGTRRARLMRFLFWSLVPVALLMLSNRLLAGSAISRAVLWHPPSHRHLEELRYALAFWGRPNQVEWHPERVTWLALGTLAVWLGLVLWGLYLGRRTHDQNLLQGLRIWLGFLFWYTTTVLAAITLVDFSTSLDTRILLPVFLAGSLVLVLAGWAVARRFWWLGLVLGWAMLTLARYHLHYDRFHLARLHRRGGILREDTWQQADMWPVLRSLPPEVPIYTPEFQEVLYYADHPTGLLDTPTSSAQGLVFYDPVQGRFRPLPYRDLRAWLQALAQRLRGRCAVLAIPTLQAELRATREAQYRLLRQVFPVWKQLRSGYLLLSDPQACAFLQETR